MSRKHERSAELELWDSREISTGLTKFKFSFRTGALNENLEGFAVGEKRYLTDLMSNKNAILFMFPKNKQLLERDLSF